MHRDLYAADSIGEAVMELAQHGGTAVVESLDQRRGPQRPGPIEIRHGRDPGHLQHPVEGAGFGRGHPAQVEADVEVGGVLPSRRRRRRGLHDPLAPDGLVAG